MKKLLFALILSIAPLAIANNLENMPAPEINTQSSKWHRVKKIGTDIKDLGSDIGGQVAELVTMPVQMVKDSEFAEVAVEVADQLTAFFPERYEAAKDVVIASIDATKNLGKKVTDSTFASKIKDANQAVIDSAQKAATNVKNVANDVANSQIIEDLTVQFAEAPREAWNNIAALFSTIKEKFI